MKTCQDCRNYEHINSREGKCSVKEIIVNREHETCEYFDDVEESNY